MTAAFGGKAGRSDSDRTEQAAREPTVKQMWIEHGRLKTRIETMNLDKLDGRVMAEFFDERSGAWRREQETILRRIHEVQNAAPAPVETAIDALRFTSRSCELFEQQSASEQRRLLQLLIEEAAWQKAKLRASLFDRSRFCGIRTAKATEKKRR